MAASDKNIVISPQRGSATLSPSLVFTGDGADPISIYALDGTPGSLSFEGSAGQLFSITNNLTSGSIFSVNDVSGIPSLDVDADGTVSIASYGGSVGIGTASPSSSYKLDVLGDVRIDGNLTITQTTTISGLNADKLDGQEGSYYQPASTALTTSTAFGGDVSGTYNAIIVADDSHNHIIGNVDGLQTALNAKAPLASPTLTGTPTAPTAAAGTNTTQIATTAFVSTAVSNLVDAAPSTLDTLNELAAALGDDANFSTTVTNSIATKLSLSGGQMTGSITFSGAQTVDGRDLSVDGAKLDGIESGATADQTASEILTAIKTVDGSGSGLDADTLDGQQGSYYQPASTALTTSTTFGGDVSGTYNAIVVADDSHNHIISNVDGLQSALDLKAPLASPALTGTPTAPTATAGTNTTQLATTAFVSTAVSNLVDSAPTTLDTLNELAAALGDDPNFATTVTNSIATKLPLAGGTMTGNITFSGAQTVDGRDVSADGAKLDGIESGATADQTASEILTAIKTVDGSGSGLDADTLDGQQGSYYLDYNNFSNTPTIPTNNNQLTNGAGYITSSGSITGSAGTLDGLDSTQFLRSDAANTATGPIAWDGALATFDPPGTGTDTATDVAIALESGLRIAGWNNGYIRTLLKWTASSDIEIGQDATELIAGINLLPGSSGVAKVNGNTIWHAGNDGSGSGLDADLLDGQQGSYYLNTSTTFGGDVSGTYNAIVVADDSHTHDGRYYTESESNTRYFRSDAANDVDVRLSSGNGRGLKFWDSNDYKIWMSSATDITWGGRLDSTSDYNMYFGMSGGTNRGFVFQTNGEDNVFQIESTGQVRTASPNIYANGNIVWHAGNDGAGSGLDADTLDGINSGGFLRSNADDTATGKVTFTNFRADAATFNDITNRVPSGFYQDGGSATTAEGWPQTTNSWYHLLSNTHSNTSNYFSMQFAGSFYNSSDIYYRSTSNSGTTAWNKLWHAGNEGSGSGLDADLLDGLNSSSFLRSDANDSTSGTLTITSNSSYPLDINGTDDAKIVVQGSSDPYIQFKSGTTDRAYLQYYSPTGSLLLINQLGGTYGLRITQDSASVYDGTNGYAIWHAGNDGAGSGLDADTLDGNQGSDFVTQTELNSLASGFLRSDIADQKTSGTLRFNDNVILSLGTGNDAELFCDGSHLYLDLNSGIGNFYIRDDTTTRFTFDDTGDFTATGNVTAYSDINLKENIEVIPNALDKVEQLRGVTYNRNDMEGAPRHAGVIAQEVEKVLPEVVQTNEEGIKSVAYGNMIGLLIEAIKEQQKQIDMLKGKLGIE